MQTNQVPGSQTYKKSQYFNIKIQQTKQVSKQTGKHVIKHKAKIDKDDFL